MTKADTFWKGYASTTRREVTDIDIYSFINSPDVADYCWEIDKVYAGIFWVIAENADLTGWHLLMFGIPCDGYGSIISKPEIEPNARSGKTYNHKITWETEVENNPDHEPYNRNP